MCTAVAIEPEMISIESTQEDTAAEARFIFAATITEVITSFSTTLTSTLSTYPFCFSITAATIACSTSVVTGRKRRAAAIEPLPKGLGAYIDGEEVHWEGFVTDYSKMISPSPREAKEGKFNKLEFRRMEVLGTDICLGSIQPYGRTERSDPRFVTFRTTVTTSVASTTTITTAGATQTIALSNSWNGAVVAQPGNCHPVSLLSTSLGIPACG
jgi:hypothetical protein